MLVNRTEGNSLLYREKEVIWNTHRMGIVFSRVTRERRRVARAQPAATLGRVRSPQREVDTVATRSNRWGK